MITHLTALHSFIFSSTLWARKVFPAICRRENETWGHTRKFLAEQGTEFLLPGPPFSILKKPQTPIKPLIQGQCFLCVRHGQGEFFLFWSSSFLSYLFLHPAGPSCTVDKAAELEGIFLQHIILCLPDGLHMELCEWARVAKCILPGAVK